MVLMEPRFVDRAIDSQAQIEFALRRESPLFPLDSPYSRVEKRTGAFDFTYGAIESILTPIFDFYPAHPPAGSPYNTGEALFGLQSAYKRASSLMGDIYFQVRPSHNCP